MTDIQEQISLLIALQGVELEILKTARQMSAWSDEAVALDRAAAEKEAAAAAEQGALGELRKTYRSLEAEAKVNAASITKSNEKLRAVKTNKEYQSILKEIEEMRKKESDIEDRMLDLLDKIDAQETAAKQRVDQAADFVQSCNQKKGLLADQARQEEAVVEQLNQKMARLRAEADPKAIATLEEVKRKVRGLAVVPVEQAVCMGCHMNIPPQLFNELLRFDELRFCPHCNRIIYWKEKEEEGRSE